jgi:hypothetical protein
MNDARLSPDDAALDMQLSAALATMPAGLLFGCPPVRPLAAQVRIVNAAFARARAAGLRLPGSLPVHFVAGNGATHGMTVRTTNGSISVTLDASALPDQLRLVCLHEAQHVADFYAGLDLPKLESERRAVLFVARLEGWR